MIKSDSALCPICGKEFSKWHGRLTCSEQCARELQRRYMHSYYLQKIKGKRKKPKKARFCAVCAKEFYSQNSRSKCCSPECTAIRLVAYYKAYNEKRRSKKLEDETSGEKGL